MQNQRCIEAKSINSLIRYEIPSQKQLQPGRWSDPAISSQEKQTWKIWDEVFIKNKEPEIACSVNRKESCFRSMKKRTRKRRKKEEGQLINKTNWWSYKHYDTWTYLLIITTKNCIHTKEIQPVDEWISLNMLMRSELTQKEEV